ncbi:hypothetical protein, partial [Pseudomonas sp. PNPG3]|uniref:hypothetical protein n=1 Tax=Pseudomonas sp. PNPG3 TaxID=2919497 RepID=UPI001FFCB17A
MSQKPSEPNLAERIFWEEHSRYPKYRIHYYVPHFRDDARTASAVAGAECNTVIELKPEHH